MKNENDSTKVDKEMKINLTSNEKLKTCETGIRYHMIEYSVMQLNIR